MHEKHLSIEGADNKQSKFANELRGFYKGIKGLEKKSFLNSLGLLFSVRKKLVIALKADYSNKNFT